jgi:hypothetical protein
MIRMAVRDHRPLDRPHRVDMEAARLAAEAGGNGHQDILRAHAFYIGGPASMFSRAVFGRHVRA